LNLAQAAKLEAQAREKAAAVTTIRATDERDLWRGDLDAFLEVGSLASHNPAAACAACRMPARLRKELVQS